jgi:hypothetical protein
MSYRNSSSTAAVLPRRSIRSIAVSVLAFLFAGAMLLLGGRQISASAPVPQEPAKKLIYAGWFGNTIPTPSYIATNKAFLETQPFNGLAVYMRNPSNSINATTAIMKPTSISYDSIMSVLAPINGLNFTQLRDNFAVVMGSGPPDFFDSWSVTVQNFSNLAKAAKDAGLRGIIFDNEQYFSPWGDYPSGVKYSAKTLAEYQAQAVVRGREAMQAMVAQFPDIRVITLHGPYVSEPDAPSSLLFPQWQSGNELLGPFFAGFQEGTSQPGQNVDGGELYNLRTASQFQNSYNWRRYDLPSSQVDCKFISSGLRNEWAGNVSIGFGVYDKPWGGATMSAPILKDTLSNALSRADEFVWFYAEAATYLLPSSQGGASATWVDAVRDALPAGEAATSPLLSGGGSGGSSGGKCGLLGIEVVPLFIALALLRARRRSN